MFLTGGDPARARAAIDRAIALSPDDAALHLISSFEHDLHAEIPEAFDALLAAIDRARTSSDPLAPWVAEVALDRVAGYRGNVARWEERALPVLSRVVDEPKSVGAVARAVAGGASMEAALRRGDIEESRRIARAVGCVAEARVAGPFGTLPLLGFDQRFAAEGRGPLAAEYDLGPNRGMQPVREERTNHCTFHLGGGALAMNGSFVVESMIDVATAGDHLVIVQTPSAVRVRLDGNEIGAVDTRRHVASRYASFEVPLTAGRHEIEVKLSTRVNDPVLDIVVVRETSTFDPARGARLPEAEGVLSRMLRALAAYGRGNAVEARELLRVADEERATPSVLLARARATYADPFLTDGRRDDEARSLFQRALARDPNAYEAELELALLEQGVPERLTKLRAIAERVSTVGVLLTLARQLAEAGYAEESERVVERAREVAPESCGAIAMHFEALAERSRIAEANALVERLMSCDARSYARLRMLERQRRWDDMRAEIARLEPLLEPVDARSLTLELARATGDEERIEAVYAADAREFPYSPGRFVHETDRALARNDLRGALATLDGAIERTPRFTPGLRAIRRTLSRNDWLDAHRLDGAAVLREYEASGRTYDRHGQVLVLDYMVTRVWHDGTATNLIHQIQKIQSEESLEALGQLELPGRVLTLRSIKPDGRRLEPDAIEGVDHIEMPSLAIGDYVEYEYVTEDEPGANASFRSGGWVFQSYSEPFDWSRIVVITPRNMPLVVDARGPVPEPELRIDGDLEVRTWTVRESRPLEAEPRKAPRDVVLPSLSFGVRATWDVYFDGWREALSDRDRIDPAAARLVREILADAHAEEGTAEDKAHALYLWVMENVEPGGDFSGVAPLMLAERTGNRTRVLRYMLELAGVEANLVFARSYGERTPGELVDGNLYGSAVVQVVPPRREPFYVFAEERGAAFGHLPQSIRGSEGVVLREGLPRVTLPSPPLDVDLRDVEVAIEVARDGSARIDIVETMRGTMAAFWRQQLEDVPAAELEEAFGGAYASRVIPGSELTALAMEGREDPDALLVFRYSLAVRRIGRGGAGRLHIPMPFAQSLADGLASLPQRTTEELVWGVSQRVVVRVRGPEGPGETSADVAIGGESGPRYTRRSRRDGGALVVERTLVLPRMIVEPARYAAFAALCRRIDEADHAEVAVAVGR
jgi:hypothetical protein